MNNIHTFKEAYNAAVENINLENNDPVCTGIVLSDGIYEIQIRTLFLSYDIYVTADSLEVVGIDTEPVVNSGEVFSYNFEVKNIIA